MQCVTMYQYINGFGNVPQDGIPVMTATSAATTGEPGQ